MPTLIKKSKSELAPKMDVRKYLSDYMKDQYGIEEEKKTVSSGTDRISAVEFERRTREFAESEKSKYEQLKGITGTSMVGVAKVVRAIQPDNPIAKPLEDGGKVLKGEKSESSLTGGTKLAASGVRFFMGESSPKPKTTCQEAIFRCFGFR